MRRVLGLQQKEEGEIDLTPMLDVVFIMLIFFIVTATFVKEMGLDVNTLTKIRMSRMQINKVSWCR